MATRVLDTLLTRLQFSGDTRALDEANRKVERLRKGIGNVGKAMTAIGGAGAAAGFFVGRTILEAERVKNNLEAVGQLSADAMAKLNAQARDLGASTAYSFSDVTRAQTELKLAGLEVNDVMAATPHVMYLAAAGQMEMGRAANLTTGILNSYGLSADETQRVTDVLASVASSSATTVAELGVSFRGVGISAHAMGLDIEQTGAIFGTIRNMGVTAEKARVTLQNFVGILSDPSGEAEEGLRSLLNQTGVAYEEFEGMLLSGQMDAAMATMAQGLDAMGSSATQNAALTRIFGQENSSAILGLLTNMDMYRRLENSYRDVTGANRQMYETQTQGLVGTVAGLKSVWEAFQLTLGDAGFTSSLNTWIERLTKAIGKANEWINARDRLAERENAPMGTAEWRQGDPSFMERMEARGQSALGTLIAYAVPATAVMVGLGAAFWGVSKVMQPFITAGRLLWRTLRGLWSAGRFLYQQVGQLNYRFFQLRYYTELYVRQPAARLLNWARNIVRPLARIGDVVRNIARGFQQLGQPIMNALRSLGPRLTSALSRLGPQAGRMLVQGLLTGLRTAAPHLLRGLAQIVATALGGVGAATLGIAAGIAAGITAAVVGIVGGLIGFDRVFADAKASWESFANLWRNPAQFWQETVQSWNAFMRSIREGTIWADMARDFRLSILDPMAEEWGPRIDWLRRQWERFTGYLSTATDWAGRQVSRGMEAIGSALRIPGRILEGFRDTALVVFGAIGAGWGWLAGIMQQGSDAINNTLRRLGVPVDWLGRQWDGLRQRIADALAWIADRALDIAEFIPDWAADKAGIDTRGLEQFAQRLRQRDDASGRIITMMDDYARPAANPLTDAFGPTGPRVPIAPTNTALMLAGGAAAGGTTTRNNQLSVGSVNVNITVDGSGAPGDTASAVSEQFRSQMRDVLETMVADFDSGIAE